MKRDNEYLRELLFRIESDKKHIYLIRLAMPMSEEEQKEHHHLLLLCDDGYLKQIDGTKSAFRLTAQGHDFIEAVRDDGIWEKTKRAVAESGGSATFEMVKSIAMGFLKKKLSEHADINL